jgi:hypothetical protein
MAFHFFLASGLAQKLFGIPIDPERYRFNEAHSPPEQ